jgi:hypothetical protein
MHQRSELLLEKGNSSEDDNLGTINHLLLNWLKENVEKA